jgi:broad specificity phosphatase PhoE
VRSTRRWPATHTLVRHGESAGNIARARAEAAGVHDVDVAVRDMDVPLSDLGSMQAEGLGRWLADLGREQPTVVIASPYLRAEETARRALDVARMRRPIVLDERLREREFGVLDRLTHKGIGHRYPEQAALRARVGKFYHRPPGGESWCDVALRVRSFLDTVSREHAKERVLVVAHQVVVFMFCYVLEDLTETEVLELDRRTTLANCSITTFVSSRRQNRMSRVEFNSLAALARTPAPVTKEPDTQVAAR